MSVNKAMLLVDDIQEVVEIKTGWTERPKIQLSFNDEGLEKTIFRWLLHYRIQRSMANRSSIVVDMLKRWGYL